MTSSPSSSAGKWPGTRIQSLLSRRYLPSKSQGYRLLHLRRQRLNQAPKIISNQRLRIGIKLRRALHVGKHFAFMRRKHGGGTPAPTKCASTVTKPSDDGGGPRRMRWRIIAPNLRNRMCLRSLLIPLTERTVLNFREEPLSSWAITCSPRMAGGSSE